jgi:hypothetical protein
MNRHVIGNSQSQVPGRVSGHGCTSKMLQQQPSFRFRLSVFECAQAAESSISTEAQSVQESRRVGNRRGAVGIEKLQGK